MEIAGHVCQAGKVSLVTGLYPNVRQRNQVYWKDVKGV